MYKASIKALTFIALFMAFPQISDAETRARSKELRNSDGLCLGVQGGSQQAGTPIIAWDCDGTPNQQWSNPDQQSFQPLVNSDGLCVGVDGGSTSQGTHIIAWYCDGTPNQQWQQRSDGSIVNKDGLCIGVEGGSRQPGTSVISWNCDGTSNQQFISASGSSNSTQYFSRPLANMPPALSHCQLGDVCASTSSNIHVGVDYMVSSGESVYSLCQGTVVYSAPTFVNIWNRFVIIDHSGCVGYSSLYGYYGHVNSSVSVGTRVSAGDRIGSIADWGNNSHLHLGVSTQYYSSGWGYQSSTDTWLDPASFNYQN